MQSHVSHLVYNVRPENLPFYKETLAHLGWSAMAEGEGMLGVTGPHEVSLWFIGYTKDGVVNDYDGAGLNHLALGVPSQADVDAAAAYLTERGVAMLFETPRHRPDFTMSPDQTYYQIMFETPDRILIEVVYTGPLGE